MTTEEIELKPCPFCGANAEFESTTEGDDDCNCVCCPDCTLSMMNGPIGIGWYRTRQEAADAWNTRAPNCEIDRLRARVADTDGAITVLGFQNAELRARVAELEAERADDDALRERMADTLKRTAIALRGPEPPLTAWSWHDLPERAAAAIASIYLLERVARDLSDLRGLVPMLVDRFLCWKLPDDFAPDCGITFKRESDYEHPVYGRTKYEPVGTNLLTAVQATAMFEHLLGIDAAAAKGEPDTEEKTKACPRCHMGEYMDRDGDWHECLTCDRTGLVPDTDASAKDGA